MDDDLSKYSDAELEAMLTNGGVLPGENALRQPKNPDLLLQPKSFPEKGQDLSLGEPGWKLALAGAGADLDSLYEGAKDKFKIAFRPPGKAGEESLAKVMADRAEKKRIDDMLFSNPEAQFGRVAGAGLGFAAAPARLPAQVALSGALGALTQPRGPSSGLPSELASSALTGGEDALAAGVVGKGLQLAGKTAGASTNRFSDPAAMALNDNAKRLGVDLRIADLDPGSSFGKVERSFPGAEGKVRTQASQLENALNSKKDVPSSTGRSTEERVLPGENLRQGFKDASDQLYKANQEKWNDLDKYVVTNKLRPVVPTDTHASLQSIGNDMTQTTSKGAYKSNPIFDLIEDKDPEAAKWIKAIAVNPRQNTWKGIPFGSLSQMRIAINKAYGAADRALASNPTDAEKREIKKGLNSLRNSIDSDMDNWSQANGKNKEAMGLWKDANDFYRERIVPDVINNRIVNKASKAPIGMNQRGYGEAQQMYRDVIAHPELIDRIRPEMLPGQRDLLDTFRTAEDARNMLTTGKAPEQSKFNIATLLRAIAGHPIDSAASVLGNMPGVRELATSRAMKKLHFGKNLSEGESPLARMIQGASAYPRNEVEQTEESLLRPGR